MSDYHINIFYSEEDNGYIADIPDLDSCSAFGETAEAALTQVKIAKQAWIEAARQAGSRYPNQGIGRSSAKLPGERAIIAVVRTKLE